MTNIGFYGGVFGIGYIWRNIVELPTWALVTLCIILLILFALLGYCIYRLVIDLKDKLSESKGVEHE